MDFLQFRNALNEIIPISDENWEMIAPCLRVQKLEADEYLLHRGEICTFLAFIEVGTMRAFYTKNEETEVNLLLNAAQEFISP